MANSNPPDLPAAKLTKELQKAILESRLEAELAAPEKAKARKREDDGKNHSISEEDRKALLNDKGKNKQTVVCRCCGSVVFPANVVVMIKLTRQLEIMSDYSAGNLPTEKTEWWWTTTDDLVFDTVGWKTINTIKSLVCGDCEVGPFGLREIDPEKTTYLVAVERVKYI